MTCMHIETYTLSYFNVHKYMFMNMKNERDKQTQQYN